MMSMQDARFDGILAHWMLYFSVEDCEAFATQVLASGGKVIMPPTKILVGQFAIFRDPQAAVFSILQMNAEPSCQQSS